MKQFEVTDADWDALLARRWRAFGALLAATAVPAAVILYVEYRLMLFAIILLAMPLIALIETLRTRAARRAFGPCRVQWDEGGVTLTGAAKSLAMPFPANPGPPQPIGTAFAPVRVDRSHAGLRVVRFQPDLLVFVEGSTPTKFQLHFVPAPAEANRALVEHVRQRGVPAQEEKSVALAVGGILFGAVGVALTGKLAAVLVLVSIANYAMWGVNRSGSLLVGGLCMGGAFALLIVRALIYAAFQRKPKPEP